MAIRNAAQRQAPTRPGRLEGLWLSGVSVAFDFVRGCFCGTKWCADFSQALGDASGPFAKDA